MKLFYFHIVLLFSLFEPIIVTGQNNYIDPVKALQERYRHFDQPEQPADPKIGFINSDSILRETGINIIQIMIIRHQKVDLPQQRNYTYREACNYIDAYDTAGILPITFSVMNIRDDEIDSVYCSTLPRSQETAVALTYGNIPLSPNNRFNEFKKYPPPLPLVRFPLWSWRMFSTVEWALGLSTNIPETYREGRNRAKSAARFLDAQAIQNGKVLLVAHGFLNHYLEKYLRKNGWTKIIDGGHRNLGVTLMVKED